MPEGIVPSDKFIDRVAESRQTHTDDRQELTGRNCRKRTARG
ncbi:hypothetical protein POG22_04380 [Geitlerinema sp. CS-897]|nr:hypothetical protein [Geitlerinema sp. CS-897]